MPKILDRFKDYLVNKSDRYLFYRSEYTKLLQERDVFEKQVVQERDVFEKQVVQERDKLKKQVDKLTISPHPPGHFYSPVNDLKYLKNREKQIWQPNFIEGIQLNEKEQLNLIKSFSKYYPEFPFKYKKQPNLRYYFENTFYLQGDATLLYYMIRRLKPNKIIEVGSGFSSAVMMDVNDFFFEKKIEISFIEPDPHRLYNLMSKEDKIKYKCHTKIVQDVDMEIFKELEPNDILFIDSSHVIKTGSDVQHIFFKILPELKSRVYIHFHDVFYPFEYPKRWILDNHWTWNEYYLLMAFLMYNTSFEIVLSTTYLIHYHKKIVKELGLTDEDTLNKYVNDMGLTDVDLLNGSSIWLKKL